MRHLLTLTLALAALTASAQDTAFARRGRIQNVTDPSTLHAAAAAPRRVGTRATAPIPATGSPRLPIVLVQFADTLFKVADTDQGVHDYYDDFFNAPPGQPVGTGNTRSYRSVAEYYRQQSDSLFTPQFTVIGPVTLSQSYRHYGENSAGSKDIHISQFYSEACRLAMQQADVQWSDFDNDHSGTVDFIYFIYAGEGENGTSDTYTIWPKESASPLSVNIADGSTITFGSFGCSNECYGFQPDGIGAIVHEMGHGLGLPDFYDVRANGTAYGLDYWDIMDSGCYQAGGLMPCGMSAYELDFMGWRPLVTLQPDSAYTLTLKPLSQGGTAYRILNTANPDGNEYFILENRQNTSFDTYLGWPRTSYQTRFGANHGLLVTHVDYNAAAWTSNRVNVDDNHQRITIVPADGTLSSYNATVNSTATLQAWAADTHGDLYPQPAEGDRPAVTTLSSYAVFTGTPFTQTITNIVEHPDGTITLDINGGKAPQTEDPDDQTEEPDVPEIA